MCLPNTLATAAARPITAREPLSKYRNGGSAGRPSILRKMAFAAYLPPCMATWANPGKGFPCFVGSGSQIADHGDVRIVRNGQVGFYLDPSSFIRLGFRATRQQLSPMVRL